MKVTSLITRSDTLGGAQIHVRDLSCQLLERGHEVIVLVGREGPFTEDLRAQGIPYRALRHLVRSIRPVTDIRGVREIHRILADLKPDLLAIHSAKAGWLGRLAGRSLGIPVIFTAHGWAFTEGVALLQRKGYATAERLVSPLASRIITVSEYDRQLALSHCVAPPEKLVTVHNGIPDVPKSLHAEPVREVPRLIMVARFAEPKDHATLFRALAELSELDWQLDLVGDGPLWPDMETLANELGLKDRVRFLGLRKDVAECLAEAQGFVLISKWEGLPLSILEAMRAGLPVVASDVGGIREALMEGESGFLIPRGNAKILNERLRRLITDPDLRARMGAAGRARYESRFTFERMFEKTLQVYRGAVMRTGYGT